MEGVDESGGFAVDRGGEAVGGLGGAGDDCDGGGLVVEVGGKAVGEVFGGGEFVAIS